MNRGKILFGLLVCLPVFLFLANNKIKFRQSSSTLYAAYTICEYGERYCNGSTRYYCNSSYDWSSVVCANGCSNGYCLTLPTPAPTCDSTHCGNCGTLATCNANTGCNWDYSGGYCENNISCSSGSCGNCGTVASCNARTGCVWSYNGNYCETSPLCSAICRLTDYCAAIGGSPSTTVDCQAASMICCSGGQEFANECSISGDCSPYGTCYTCDDVTIGTSSYTYKKCQRHVSSGGSGSVGGANGSSSCTIPSSGLCNSGYGVSVTDSVGSDGTFNWTCEGQTSGSCRSAGSDAYGSAIKLPATTGVCSTTTNTCSAGVASGVGTTRAVSTGIDNIWSCTGSCGGGTDACSSTLCTNATKVNGACISNASLANVSSHSLCIRGNESNVKVTETEITWDCLGSSNTCAEGNGTDALNCSSIIDQKPWFQVNNGSILTKGKVINYVPGTTCDTNGNNCASTVNNGAVYSKSSSSTSGFDRVSATNENGFNFKTYTYNQLKSDYFNKKGVGSVFTENSDWSNIKNVDKVAFVDGDLEINSDLDTSNFVMVIAKGKIIIDPSVSTVNAILVGNEVVAKSTEISSTDPVGQLTINGMVHGVSGVEFTRSLYPNNLNNTAPSVVVNYKPELLFMIPQELTKAFSQWKIN